MSTSQFPVDAQILQGGKPDLAMVEGCSARKTRSLKHSLLVAILHNVF